MRRYQVPSKGRAEILVSDQLANLVGLESLRFVQEGAEAPGVYVQFKFAKLSMFGMVKVREKGDIDGFHQLSEDIRLRVLVEAIALSYYRDLVIPGDIHSSKQTWHPRRLSITQSPTPPKPRIIPRRQIILIFRTLKRG